MKYSHPMEPEIIGSTVMGERGQVVIPKQARDHMKLKAGDKLIVIQHMNGALVLMPAREARKFLAHLTKKLTKFSKFIK